MNSVTDGLKFVMKSQCRFWLSASTLSLYSSETPIDGRQRQPPAPSLRRQEPEQFEGVRRRRRGRAWRDCRTIGCGRRFRGFDLSCRSLLTPTGRRQQRDDKQGQAPDG